MENDSLVEDYNAKLDYLKEQYARLWQRFGFFLSIEMALFGYLGWLAFDKGNLPAIRLPAILGLSVSVIWYVAAAQDRALVYKYRERLEAVADEIGKTGCQSKYGTEHPGAEVRSFFKSPLCWYWSPMSITRLPVWISLVLILLWLLLTFYGESWLRGYISNSTSASL